ncbi:MAG: hypothetical protein EZS28_022986 [Streblomastix strix]|uniref:Uncharacterized protein n=1 Tax=Streblomastix strix TaxID=222440 RepID=A0A5J4VGH7_9EUKA|nr:MAG: hypothetical protein EZS28_022986 [Streblomastix strix]
MFDWDAPDQNIPPKSTKSTFPSPDYRIANQVHILVHEKIIQEMTVQSNPYQFDHHPLSLISRAIQIPHKAREVAYIIFQQYHPDKTNFSIQELKNNNLSYNGRIDQDRKPSFEDIQELSTVLLPLRAGINPKYLDPRLIAEAANRIRSLCQITCDRFILHTMGLPEPRITRIIHGSPFNSIEISSNLAFLTFLATSPLAGIFPRFKIYFSQCFWGCPLSHIPLPIPLHIFAPPSFKMSPPQELLQEIIRRKALPYHIHAINQSIYIRAAIFECNDLNQIQAERNMIILQCEAHRDLPVYLCQQLARDMILFPPQIGSTETEMSRSLEALHSKPNFPRNIDEIIQLERATVVQQNKQRIQIGMNLIQYQDPYQHSGKIARSQVFLIEGQYFNISTKETKKTGLLGGGSASINVTLFSIFLSDSNYHSKHYDHDDDDDDDDDSAGCMLIADQQINDDDDPPMIEPNKHNSQVLAGINKPAAPEIYEEGHENFKHILSFGQELRAQDVPPYNHQLGQIHWTERDTFSYLAATKALAGPLLYEAIAAISIYSQSSVQDKDNKLIAAETACSKILGIPGYIHKNCDQQREVR